MARPVMKTFWHPCIYVEQFSSMNLSPKGIVLILLEDKLYPYTCHAVKMDCRRWCDIWYLILSTWEIWTKWVSALVVFRILKCFMWQYAIMAIDKSLHMYTLQIIHACPCVSLHGTAFYSACDMHVTCVGHWSCGWLVPYISLTDC